MEKRQEDFKTKNEFEEYVIQEILKNSENEKEIEKASEEWEILESQKEKGTEKENFFYDIVNTKTGSLLKALSSETIKIIGNQYLNDLVTIYETLYKIKEKIINNKEVYIKDFNAKTIDYLYTVENIFPKDKYGENGSEENYWFMHVVLEDATSLNQIQLKKYKALLMYEILPVIKQMPFKV